ncbi:double-strand break repair helicase AddA [Ciceribacter sp. L1K23]|uniref:double-strand break repair helicase AddA n=1 Tax=Ciceribacter sp. L1K23 TaxID=2820276 RepID=UPI001B8267D2|nr:double-strand break repair helicase AddA [Ciceribacter sp. L1K23]MBR0557630.1 double-strand break repair helicase AddA [Ciceribacter sp. L1K23]
MSDITMMPEGLNPADWTTAQQALASDPRRSAWVSANAGSGKTHVLTQRVIRLLLSGARPSSVLCLTYTKAAASEMSNRVFARLAEWARLDDQQLALRIEKIEGQPPDHAKLRDARQLFAKALETPGGLKIQTIHAFCEALLHQFPLEANVAGHFTVLEDRAASTLLDDVKRSLLTLASARQNPELVSAFEQVLSLADEHGLEALLADIVSNRQSLRDFLSAAERGDGFNQVLRGRLGLKETETVRSAAEAVWPLAGLSGENLAVYLELADKIGGANAQAVASELRAATGETDPMLKLARLENALLTKLGAPKSLKTVATAEMQRQVIDVGDWFTRAQEHLLQCRERVRLVQTYEATSAALVLAQFLIGDYEYRKKVRGQLDFEDLIARTAELLTKSDAAPWVHYKLDQGIDHILVDEAQDTSPVQWSVIRSLRDDFFSGESARPGLRTFFAVGDEKQSIYSFQGARPERFSEESRATERDVSQGGLDFSAVRLPLSFRSTGAVLSAVDQVFRFQDNARGLSGSSEAIVHVSNRIGHPGRVEVWDIVAADATQKSDDWTAPFDSTPENAPPAIVARRIAETMEQMIRQGKIVDDGVERAIRAGDILVLVRKRDSFVGALTRELKRRGNIPVAGADRLKLTTHIAIQDLLALGRFVLLPSDDLSLASLLKSPLFNLTETELYEAAAFRPEGYSLWQRILTLAETDADSVWHRITSELLQLVERSRRSSVHGFYAHVLGAFGGRRKFLGRLGSEAADVLDEFTNLTLDHESGGMPGLQAFVAALETEAPEIKREQDSSRDEVRIMTVHASKGLEAPVVFLVDGGGRPFNSNHLPRFRFATTEHGKTVPIWVPTKNLETCVSQFDRDRIRQLAEDEYRRLLYVGMTRAADRLVICGYCGKQRPSDIWHDMVSTALRAEPRFCREERFTTAGDQWDGIVWELPEQAARIEGHEPPPARLEQYELPPALLTPLPPPSQLPRPLSPSGVGFFVEDAPSDAIIGSRLFAPKQEGDRALQKGRLVHRLLQVLPDVPEQDRMAAAERYISRAARFWTTVQRLQLFQQIAQLIQHPDMRKIMSSYGQAEVSIMGTLMIAGDDRAVSGRIDRLAVVEGRVILIDYKTNRIPPRDLSHVPFPHRAQLAIYRELLKPIYPGHVIDGLLIYTEEAKLLELPPELLDSTLAELNTL